MRSQLLNSSSYWLEQNLKAVSFSSQFPCCFVSFPKPPTSSASGSPSERKKPQLSKLLGTSGSSRFLSTKSLPSAKEIAGLGGGVIYRMLAWLEWQLSLCPAHYRRLFLPLPLRALLLAPPQLTLVWGWWVLRNFFLLKRELFSRGWRDARNAQFSWMELCWFLPPGKLFNESCFFVA